MRIAKILIFMFLFLSLSIISDIFFPIQSKIPAKDNITVAFIGDQGLNGNSRAVLYLIKREGAGIVIHQHKGLIMVHYFAHLKKIKRIVMHKNGKTQTFRLEIRRFWHAQKSVAFLAHQQLRCRVS